MYEDNYANWHLKSQFYVYGIETLMGNEFQRNADREMDDGNGWCACPVESTTDCSLSLLSVSFSGRGRTLYNSFRVLVAETSDPASGSHISLSLSFPKPRPCVHTYTQAGAPSSAPPHSSTQHSGFLSFVSFIPLSPTNG